MEKLFFLLSAAFLILAGCTQDNVQSESTKPTREQRFNMHVGLMRAQFLKSGILAENQSSDSRATCNKVPICHKGKSIVGNKSAVPVHLAHSDQLTCCANSCLNDTQVLQDGGPITFYYDTDVNDCLGFILDGYDESVILGYSGGDSFITAESYTYDGTTQYYVYVFDGNDFTCFNDSLTSEEYACARNYLRSFIGANSCIPNFCDL